MPTDKNKKTLDYRRGIGRIKAGGGKTSARGINKGRGAAGEGKVIGSAGTRGVKNDHTSSGRSTGRSGRVVKEKGASAIKKRGTVAGKGPSANKYIGRSKTGKLENKNRPQQKTASAIKKKNLGSSFSGAYGGKKK